MHNVKLWLLSTSAVISWCWSLPVEEQRPFSYPFTNPDENRGRNKAFLEGDILASKRRSANFKYYKTWYNRTIPYAFDNTFLSKPEHMLLVEDAMAVIEDVSCVRFLRRVAQKDYIIFSSTADSCHSKVGRIGRQQTVSLGDECLHPQGVILHEILHAMGLWHEQSREDRDEYVQVMWQNILKEHHINFQKRKTGEDTDEVFLSFPYDYGSVMHYSNTTFLTDYALRHNLICLRPKKELPKGVVMGQREGLSQIDRAKINALYRCDIKNCPQLSVPDHGKLHGSSTLVSDTVHYSCEPGFTLVGPTDRVCRNDGHWSGDDPVCLATSKTSVFHYCSMENPDDYTQLCGWRQATNDDLDWKDNSEETRSEDTGPFWDHTLSTVYGTYLYVEASNHPSPFGMKARLISPTFDLGRARPCLVFYTYMYGMQMGNLTVYFTDMSTSHPLDRQLFTLVGEQGQMWKQVFIQLEEARGPFVIMLEASLGDGFKSDIAIDDMIVGECATLAPLAKSNPIQETLQCFFDSDLCHFQQSAEDDFDWTFNKLATPTLFTGPDCDPVDCLDGSYLFIETSNPRRFGDTARLETPYIGGSGKRCVSFYYHMYGSSIGRLKVKQRSLLTSLELVLWEASGNQGNTWHLQHVTYDALNAYKIIFEATVGTSGSLTYKGDIAIDRIQIRLEPCTGSLSFNCSFEHDNCGWSNATVPGQTFPLSWVRHSGGTDTPNTGPAEDRTHIDGHYLYLESSRSLHGDLARLLSPALESSTSGVCVAFWFHMFGQTSGNLTMFVQDEDGNRHQVWRTQGDRGDMWVSQQVNVTGNLTAAEYSIMFEAALAGSYGDIALDDFSIQHSLCGS